MGGFERVKKRLCGYQIGSAEALGEPVIDWREKFVRVLKVVTYRGAALRLSMLICLMRLGRDNGA